MTQENIKLVDQQTISCDGGENGHPKVYLQIDSQTNSVTCPYCSQIFNFAEEV